MPLTKNAVLAYKSLYGVKKKKSKYVSKLQLINDYPIQQEFQNSSAKIRVLMGPIGSGKTRTCCMEIIRIVRRQPIKKTGKYKGWRFSRGVIIRHTFSAIKDTVLPEFEEHYHSIIDKRVDRLIITIPEEKVYSVILFKCLDNPKHVDSFMSLALTFAYICEGRTIKSFGYLGGVVGRLNREPADNGKGYLICCSNLCGTTHWLHQEFYKKQDDDLQVFIQPNGQSDEAENRKWLAETNRGDHRNYYNDKLSTMTKQMIETDIYAKWSHYFEGKEVYPEFDNDIHVINAPDRDDYVISYNTNCITLTNLNKLIDYTKPPEVAQKIVHIGFDYGRKPAMVICVQNGNIWIVLKEFCMYDTTIPKFAVVVREELNKLNIDYRHFDIVGDPSGLQKNSVIEDNYHDMMYEHGGIYVKRCWTQDPVKRRQSLRVLLEQKRIFIHKENCPILIEALSGGFHYKKLNTPGHEIYDTKPNKHCEDYSHVCEALEYAILGGGEVDRIAHGYGMRNVYDYTVDYGFKKTKHQKIYGI